MGFSGVTIDPGEFTAFAIWENSKLKDIFTYDLSGGTTDVGRIFRLSKLYGDNRLHLPWQYRVVIEDQAIWMSSAKSLASGARGDIFTTAKIAGALCLFFSQQRHRILFVQPIVWKGNLKNKVLRRILEIKFNYVARNDHEANAYGIGLYTMGIFK
jgi:hypothetical protein